MIPLTINGKAHSFDLDPELPLLWVLWVLREVAHLTATQYGCGMALCRACTVHVDGTAVDDPGYCMTLTGRTTSIRALETQPALLTHPPPTSEKQTPTLRT